ncbi:MAG: MarR family transcriptional regulator [Hungatella hathewayi]|nr:MarR family transcriptional regulator [Hungatella hathewayi]
MKNSVQEQRAELVRLDKQQDELYHRCAVHLGISDTAFWVMYFLCDFEEVYTQNALAELWCLPKQTVNSAINNLVKEGYVYLEQMAAARNSKAICLTEKGTEFCQKYIVPVLNAELKAFSQMTEEERCLFLSLTEKQHLIFAEELNHLFETKGSDTP